MASSNKMTKTDQKAGLQALTDEQEKKEVEGKKRGLLVTLRGAANLSVDEWGDDRLTALIRFLNVSDKATLPDYAAFFSMSKRYGLDPFAGQIFLFPTKGGKLKVAVERDGLLKVAQDHEDYRGYFSAAVYADDTFDFKQNGKPGIDGIEINHSWGMDRGELVAGFCAAYREGWPPQVIFRTMEEYKHLRNKDNWRDNPADMIETRCIAASHRRLFSLVGLYTSGEIQDTDTHAPLNEGAKATAATLEGLKDRVEKMDEDGAGSVESIPQAEFEVVGEGPEGAEDPDAQALAEDAAAAKE